MPTLPVTLPFDGAATVRVRVGLIAAPTVLSPSTVSSQAAVPLQSPVQPANPWPASAVAVSVTAVPAARNSVQSARPPEPQSMTVAFEAPVPVVPVTWPLDGAATVSSARSSRATVVPVTVSARPSEAVAVTATVSTPSAAASTTGVSVNAPFACRVLAGMVIGKPSTALKSSAAVAVPLPTETATVLAGAVSAVPVSAAVTVTVLAPLASRTVAGEAERTTPGRHSMSIHSVAWLVRPPSAWLARNP